MQVKSILKVEYILNVNQKGSVLKSRVKGGSHCLYTCNLLICYICIQACK